MPTGQPPALSFVPVGPMTNTDPGHALVIDNQTHTIPANTAVWYRFTYAGDKSDITITLPNGALNGLDFNVWTAQGASDWWDLTPVGRGTVHTTSSDLDWVGLFDFPGTFYVQVINATPGALPAQIMIQGSGVTL